MFNNGFESGWLIGPSIGFKMETNLQKKFFLEEKDFS
jgi:hypothetical protein